MRKWRVILIIAENKLHAHHKTHLHTVKVYNTRPVGTYIHTYKTTKIVRAL